MWLPGGCLRILQSGRSPSWFRFGDIIWIQYEKMCVYCVKCNQDVCFWTQELYFLFQNADFLVQDGHSHGKGTSTRFWRELSSIRKYFFGMISAFKDPPRSYGFIHLENCTCCCGRMLQSEKENCPRRIKDGNLVLIWLVLVTHDTFHSSWESYFLVSVGSRHNWKG